MKTLDALYTRADYARLPEGFPAQLVEGMLVKEPAPTYGHQRGISLLHARLARLVGPDLAVVAPVDVSIDDHNVYQPDLAVLRAIPPLTSTDVGIPLLVVEVLSAGTRDRDRDVKTRRYLAAGVAEVWLVDPLAATVEVHAPAGVTHAEGREVVRSTALPGFELTPSVDLAPP